MDVKAKSQKYVSLWVCVVKQCCMHSTVHAGDEGKHTHTYTHTCIKESCT